MDEGYIKYSSEWVKTDIEIPDNYLKKINFYRSKLIDAELIGKISNGPGFGNISIRTLQNQFIITGSDTGGIETLTKSHLSKVYNVNIDKNTVWSKGITIASSESMSHYAIYKVKPEINSVIHIHSNKLWNELKNKYPVTNKKIAYGTPELALEIMDICNNNSDNRIIVLGGHIDGILLFGKTIDEAYNKL
jgi:ribulose-5-phosphate 4-epimerase/fuculose-1-phosphate aldolase